MPLSPLTPNCGNPPLLEAKGMPGIPSCADSLIVELNCSRSDSVCVYPARNSLIRCGVKICVSLTTTLRGFCRNTPEENDAASNGGGMAPGGTSLVFDQLNRPKIESESEILWSMRRSS